MTRACLGFLALGGLAVGVWALFAPLQFYGAFPGCGHVWISPDGPYNEHLVRDVGALYLVTAVLCAISLMRPGQVSPFAAGLATLAFNLPHFAYHMTKLALYAPLDRAGNIVALGTALLASLWLVFARSRA